MENRSRAFFLDWPEAYEAGVEAAGGKGWNLGRLDRYGFTIPAGGVLAAGAYRNFITENNLLEDIEKISLSVTIDNIGKKETEKQLFLLREKIKAGRLSKNIQEELTFRLKTIGILEKPLAVRSSATAEDSVKMSFAGIHESFLNILGMDNILVAIKGCYASLWTPRAVSYRRKMNIKDDEVIQAVVIMEMVEAEAAGVGFSCDPRTGREDIVLIDANFGLGESVVSGAIEPDEYRLNCWCEITEKRIGRKGGKTIAGKDGGTVFIESVGTTLGQVLTDENIRRLGLLIQRVFDALGGEQNQDVEWVFDGQGFALVQARPVTALPRYTLDGLENQPDIWSNANFRDTSPMVQSTLNWRILKLISAGPENIDPIGYPIKPGVSFIRLYNGRAYFNLSWFQWYMYDAVGMTPRQMNEGMGGYQPEIEISEEKPYRGIKGIKRLWRFSKLIILGIKTTRSAQKSFDKVNDFAKTSLIKDFMSLTETDLINKLAEIKSAYLEFYPVFSACIGAADMNLLVKKLEKYFPGKGRAMANTLMVGGADITSAQQGYRLVEMAEIARVDTTARRFFAGETYDPLLWEKELPEESRFKQSLRNFLAEYGHRGVYECEIINPRWREDPSYLLNVVRSTMETANLGKIKARQKEKADEAWLEVNRKIPFYKRGLIKSLLKQALKGAELREMAKSMLIKFSQSYRLVFQETGRRLADRGILTEPVDIYHCSWSEIISILQGDWDGKGLDVLVAERKTRMKEMEKLPYPDFIIDDTPKFTEHASLSSGNALTGLGVAAGKASGAAKLIKHPEEGEKLQSGDILVAPSTDPGWTPLFLRASAIVVEIGGIVSHGAIVAREYGIPAVVNIPGVMKILKDNQVITVDGNEGKVFL